MSWLANAALFVLCAFLFSSTANAVFAALLTPSPAPPTTESRPTAALQKRSWDDRQIILSRNLFNASLLAPAKAAPEPSVVLEETKLPLVLLGTLASPNPELARASIEDQEARTHVVVAVGDSIKGAEVMRIERKRVVISENGVLRELTFDDDSPSGTKVARASRRTPTRRAAPRRRSSRKRDPAPEGLEDAIRNPADLFSQARILPKWENGQMVGVQVSAIKPGSLFEELGIENGEVITQLNGIQIDSPERSAEVMMELAESDQLSVTVSGASGERTLDMATKR
ncbi:MAG: type II secretion system protein GspC [Myxococcota bacterium]|nr:type II secretion system protein GspC [Myxococcota bacterium]